MKHDVNAGNWAETKETLEYLTVNCRQSAGELLGKPSKKKLGLSSIPGVGGGRDGKSVKYSTDTNFQPKR